MARKGIEYDDIAQAVEQLMQQGQKPTILKIREQLGGVGSPNTISKYFKEWKERALAYNQQAGSGNHQAAQNQASQGDTTESESHKTSQSDTTEPHQATTGSEAPMAKHNSSASAAQAQHSSAATPDQHSTADNSNSTAESSSNSTATSSSEQTDGESSPSEAGPDASRSAINADVNALINNTRQLSTEMVNAMANEWEMILNEDNEEVKIRKLHAALIKEQTRREAAEKVAQESKAYSETLKEQVAQRINDLRDSLEAEISFLQTQIRTLKKESQANVEYYRTQLEKANNKLINLASQNS